MRPAGSRAARCAACRRRQPRHCRRQGRTSSRAWPAPCCRPHLRRALVEVTRPSDAARCRRQRSIHVLEQGAGAIEAAIADVRLFERAAGGRSGSATGKAWPASGCSMRTMFAGVASARYCASMRRRPVCARRDPQRHGRSRRRQPAPGRSTFLGQSSCRAMSWLAGIPLSFMQRLIAASGDCSAHR